MACFIAKATFAMKQLQYYYLGLFLEETITTEMDVIKQFKIASELLVAMFLQKAAFQLHLLTAKLVQIW